MDILANILGITAVITFNFSYQLKTRRNLILCNAASRILYVLQYVLLGAVEGAALDITAFVVSLLYKKAESFKRRYLILTLVLSNVAVIGIGMLTYKNLFSLLPIIGVLFETMALIPKKESKIRILSLLGAPPWLAYNLLCRAYGSAVGNVITFITIGIAMARFDLRGRKREKPL